jgi:hypothetical protein
MHLHTVYMEYSECLPTLLNTLAEKTRFSQVRRACPPAVGGAAGGGLALRAERQGDAGPLAHLALALSSHQAETPGKAAVKPSCSRSRSRGSSSSSSSPCCNAIVFYTSQG